MRIRLRKDFGSVKRRMSSKDNKQLTLEGKGRTKTAGLRGQIILIHT